MHLRKWQIKWLNGRSILLVDSPDVPVRKVLGVRPSVDRAMLPAAFLLLLVASSSRINAGQFVNLDFESPNLPLPEGIGASASNALPSWDARVGSLELSRVALNDFPLSGADIAFYGPRLPEPNPLGNLYSVRLFSGYSLGQPQQVSISQSGDIPESAKSLRLEARIFGDYRVTLDGAPIAMSFALGGSEYDTYYGDIRSFSGKTAELRIETAAGPGFLDGGPFMYIDKISFGTLTVPEPSVYALLAFGLFSLGWRTRRALTQ